MPAERVSSAVSVLPNPSPQPPDLGNQLLACHRLEILVHNTFSLNRAVSGWRCLFLAELARLPARFRAYQPARVNLTQSWRQFLESVRWLWTPPMLQRYSHIRRQAKKDAIAAFDAERQKNQPSGGTKMGTASGGIESTYPQVIEKNWLPPRDSNPDMLIQSYIGNSENKGNRGFSSAESGKVRQNPHPRRTKKRGNL